LNWPELPHQHLLATQSVFTKGPADVLDHATREIAIGSKLCIGATKKPPGGGFKRPWPPLIRIHADSRKRIDARIGPAEDRQKLTHVVPNALARSSHH
jgi:3-polyprenyl-4-hydroxybenzoate decarboxylase